MTGLNPQNIGKTLDHGFAGSYARQPDMIVTTRPAGAEIVFGAAVKYDAISYDDVLSQHLAVMDATATSLSMDNRIPVLLFALKDPYNIIRALKGEKIGTIVKEDITK